MSLRQDFKRMLPVVILSTTLTTLMMTKLFVNQRPNSTHIGLPKTVSLTQKAICNENGGATRLIDLNGDGFWDVAQTSNDTLPSGIIKPSSTYIKTGFTQYAPDKEFIEVKPSFFDKYR